MPLEENSKASNIVRLRKQYCLHAIGVFQQSSYFLENLTPSDKSSFSLIKTTKKKNYFRILSVCRTRTEGFERA